MYEKIAYGITDEMLKQAIKAPSMEVKTQDLSGDNSTTNKQPANSALTSNSVLNPKRRVLSPSGGQFNSRELARVSQGKAVNTDPTTGEQYINVQTPVGIYSVSPETGYYTPYQTGLNNNVQFNTRFPQTLTPEQKSINSAISPWRTTTVNQRADNYIDNVNSRLTPRERQFVPQVVANSGPLMYRERARQQMDAQGPYVDPDINSVQEGTNFSNRAYTPNAVARNSNGESYNTFEKGWMQNSLAPAQQPKQPSFNPDTTPGWGLWTPKQIREYAPDKADMTPEQFAQETTPEERTKLIKAKSKADQKAKADSITYAGGYDDKGVAKDQAAYEQAVNNYDNLYAEVESTIRTPYQVQRWRDKGFTDKKIDDYVKRETTKAMERRYGKRPVATQAPQIALNNTSASSVGPMEDSSGAYTPPSYVVSTGVSPSGPVDLTNRSGATEPIIFDKSSSANIVALLLNKSKLDVLKEYFNG